ncbi:hypothetical protein INO14_14970, partial [Staphylococcus aureus]|nr:hypothetical protein [Staphylococcus aureus]
MGKEIYLDPIEFQNVLEKFEKGSSEISEVSISSIKDAKNEIILESIVELEKIIDDLSKA